MSILLQFQFHSLTAKTISLHLVHPEMFLFQKMRMKDYLQVNKIMAPKEFLKQE